MVGVAQMELMLAGCEVRESPPQESRRGRSGVEKKLFFGSRRVILCPVGARATSGGEELVARNFVSLG